MPRRPFKGKINLDVRDSMPDWEPYMPPRAPEGSPNVLIVLYDDTGLAAWEPFGGRIRMPTLQRLADDGLTYTQWHTTALCSPTRSCFLTGRNHHQNGMACITEGAIGYPGSNAHLPAECGTVAEVLRDNGWSTYWLGKNHNVPVEEANPGGTKCRLAAAAGLRPLLRLPRRRDQPVVSDARRRQPLDRPAVHARGGLPPLQGPRRPGDPDDPRRQVDRAVAAVVHVVLPRRQPRAAPRPAGVHRQVQGPVRRRLRGLPRVGAAADDREGHPARGHRADADEPDARGHATRRSTTCARGTRSPTTRRGCSRGWPRCSPASPSTPTTRSAGSSTTSRRPASSTTRSSSTAPTTARPARVARTAP